MRFLTESEHVHRAESRTSDCNCAIPYRVNMYIGLNLELVTVTVRFLTESEHVHRAESSTSNCNCAIPYRV